MTGASASNARALRQIGALRDAGYRVVLLAFDGQAPDALPQGTEFCTVAPPPGSGPRFFRAVHRAFREALGGIAARCYHASDLYVLAAARSVSLERGAAFTYDARESYPHVASTRGRPLISWFWKQFESRNVRGVAAAWTVSPGIAARLHDDYGLRAHVQYNAPALRPFEPDDYLRRATGWGSERGLIVHAGQLRPDRGIEPLIQALPNTRRDVGLVLLGGGPLREPLRSLAAECGVAERVAFVDPVPVDQVLPVCAGADAGVTFLEDSCLNHRLALPNKLFDYLAAGLPVLAADLPEIRQVLSLYPAGVLADTRSTIRVAEALDGIADPALRLVRREAAHRAAETFDWTKTSQDFIQQMANAIPSA